MTSTTYIPTDIALMDADQFNAAIEVSVGSVERLEPFLAPINLERTLAWLIALSENLGRQLDRWGDAKKEWYDKTVYYRSIIDARIATADRRRRVGIAKEEIAAAEDEQIPGNATNSAIKRFAHQLIEVMLSDEEDGGRWDVLDNMVSPFGGLSPRDWVARRIEKDPTRTGVNA